MYLKLALILSVHLKAEYPNTIFQPSTSIYQVITLNTLPLNVKQEEPWCISQKKISHKIRNDLNIYNPKQLESIFIEILRPDLPGGIFGTIYKHPSMNVSTFNVEFFAPLLKNLSKENKEVILTGDFNVNLLNFGKKEVLINS